ncbi:MAG: transposase [Nanoarchaeota archaeon]
MLTYKRKLKLSKSDEIRISSWIGACRVVYNMGLEIKIATYKTKEQSISKYTLMKQLTEIKDIDWIKDVPAQTLQETMDRLDRSYQTFFRTFKKGGGFPKFAKKDEYNSIVIKDIKVNNENNTVKLTNLGIISTFKDREIKGVPKRATIIKEPTGYFICIQCDGVEKPVYNSDKNQVGGIDMGISHFCIDSDGGFVANEKHFSKHERKLRIENRSLARKKKFGKNWKKQAKKLGMLHHKIANVRKDFIHKKSTDYARKYNTIFLEDLKINNMVRNKNLSKQILDCGWGMFRTMLEYKANVVRINPKNTSQKCNCCGRVDLKNRLSQSVFKCINCGYKNNADVNSALNLRSEGIAIIRKREALACA